MHCVHWGDFEWEGRGKGGEREKKEEKGGENGGKGEGRREKEGKNRNYSGTGTQSVFKSPWIISKNFLPLILKDSTNELRSLSESSETNELDACLVRLSKYKIYMLVRARAHFGFDVRVNMRIIFSTNNYIARDDLLYSFPLPPPEKKNKTTKLWSTSLYNFPFTSLIRIYD